MGDKVKVDLKNALEQVQNFITKGGFAKQLGAGTASGLVTGVVLSHVGKSVAAGVGCGIILVHIAQHRGLVGDWNQLKQQAEQKSKDLGYKTNMPAVIGNVKTFATKNRSFTAGFLGGFLLGVGL